MVLILLQLLKYSQTMETTVAMDQEVTINKTNNCPEVPEFYIFEEVKRDLQVGNITLIDVRTREEVNDVGLIPRSVIIPLNELEDAFQLSLTLKEDEFNSRYSGFRLPNPKWDTIVLSGQGGGRALHAYLKVLKLFGYCNTKVYSGSVSDWVLNGGEIIKVTV